MILDRHTPGTLIDRVEHPQSLARDARTELALAANL